MTTSSGYDKDAAFFEDLNGDRSADIAFYGQVLGDRGTLLDVGCGTGQITRHLAVGRERTVGVDNSLGMLKQAGNSKQPAGAGELQYQHASMLRLDLGEQFDACIATFNTLQHLLTWEDALTFLRSVRKHLRPGGVLVFDVFNPRFDFLVERRGPVFKQHFQSRTLDARITISEATAYDPATQINHIEYTYTREGQGGPVTTHRFDMRQYFPQELDALLHWGGFEIDRKFGDFDHSTFTGSSPKQIPVCRPR